MATFMYGKDHECSWNHDYCQTGLSFLSGFGLVVVRPGRTLGKS